MLQKEIEDQVRLLGIYMFLEYLDWRNMTGLRVRF
jgi:hypothetical protein